MRNEADLLAILEPAPVATSRPLRAAAMSALPPTTDIAERRPDVRFVPQADIPQVIARVTGLCVRKHVYPQSARRISQRYERGDTVPLTGSTIALEISRLKLGPSALNGS